MKNIFFAVVIIVAAIGACNPPQKTTETPTDSTSVNNRTDTSVSTQRDSSMHK
jgi:hypothetical protein